MTTFFNYLSKPEKEILKSKSFKKSIAIKWISTILFMGLFLLPFSPLYSQIKKDVILTGPTSGEIKARGSITLSPDFETTDADFIIDEDMYVPPVLTPTAGGDINYIYSRTLRKEITDTSKLSTLTLKDIAQQIQYFDGLGRSIQTVDIEASPKKNDVVVPVAYDDYGREAVKYLPYVVAGDGQYQSEGIADQKTWYATATETRPADTNPLAETTFENSPLNRVISQLGTGEEWQKAEKSTSFSYETNVADEVVIWEVKGSHCKYKNHYAAGELYKTKVTDENGNATTEYKDKLGQVILKTGEEGTKTYYVYDDLGLLRFVIPSKAAEANGEADLKGDILKNLCYYYQYDTRKRMTIKKLPGTGFVTMEYDQRDRLIATEDSVQRSKGETSFITYDELNRPIRTGIRYANGKADTLTYTWYDDYSFIADQKLGISYTDESGYTTNVTDKVKSRVTGTRTKILGSDKYIASVNYYDKYGRVVQVQTINQFGQTDKATSQYHFWGGVEKTMQRHRFDASNELTIEQKFQYDHAGRLLSTTESVNGKTAVTTFELAYDELGQLATKKLNTTSSGSLQKVDYTYNIRNWLTGINSNFNADENDLFGLNLYYTDTQDVDALSGKPQYNGNISAIKWRGKTEVETGYNYQAYGFNYDKLNRLTSSKYGICNTTGVFPAEYMDRYNEADLKYDNNGNILNLSRTGGYKDVDQLRFGQMDSLQYKYLPNSNQLMSISDNASVEGYGFNDLNKDTTDFAYDGNGNLTQYKDKKLKSIEYNYLNLPSKIVFDNADSIVYIYDANGTKHIKKFFESGKQKNAEYYVGSIIYQTDSTEVTADKLHFVMNAEGRLTRLKNGTFRNEYFLKDHLGNTRVVFADTLGNGRLAVLQETNYYPFGLAFTGVDLKTDKNKFLYNGKELQVDGDLGLYDYGARYYDPQIGRWHSIDPMAEKFYGINPFNYCADNPVLLNDLSGKDWTINYDIDKDGVRHYHITFTGVVVDKTTDQKDQTNRLATAITSQISSIFKEDNSKNQGFTVDIKAVIRAVGSEDDIADNETTIKIVDNNSKELEYQDDKGNTRQAAGKELNGKEVAINEDFVPYIISGATKKLVTHELGHTAGLHHPEDDNGFFGKLFCAPGYGIDRKGNNFMFGGGKIGESLHTNPTGPTENQIRSIFRLYNSGKLNKRYIDPVKE
jgi:RHS repeat-associated protein